MTTRKEHTTPLGTIVYWTNEILPNRRTLVFLPGLTADHRLFDKQIEFFAKEYNILVWDAPGHGESRPFELSFSLEDKARWLHDILKKTDIIQPVLIGQSMGGYVSQMFMQLYPHETAGFISIDSAPLQRRYMAKWEIWSLKHIEPIYRWYPWEKLKRDGAKGCATTEYGQKLMYQMMGMYEHKEYAHLSGHGYRMLAQAVELNLPYKTECPCLLICGEEDKAGSAKRYNRNWTETEKIPLKWIKNAGHNSNTDQPETVNQLINEFIHNLNDK